MSIPEKLLSSFTDQLINSWKEYILGEDVSIADAKETIEKSFIELKVIRKDKVVKQSIKQDKFCRNDNKLLKLACR